MSNFSEQLLRQIVANAKLHVGLFNTHYTIHPDEINAARLWLSALDEKQANKQASVRGFRLKGGFEGAEDYLLWDGEQMLLVYKDRQRMPRQLKGCYDLAWVEGAVLRGVWEEFTPSLLKISPEIS